MTAIDPYIRILLYLSSAQLSLPTGAYRSEELTSGLSGQIKQILQDYGSAEITDNHELSRTLITEMMAAEVLTVDNDPFAGEYLNYHEARYSTYRNEVLREDLIAAAASRIGARFFPDAFAGYLKLGGVSASSFPTLGVAPASDRVVSFSDNQITELDGKTTELIDAVSSQNQVDENPGLRELILGQLKAGRELLRAGTCRVYLIELTLIQSLKFLAARYEEQAISALATVLIEAIMKHLGLDI